MKVNPVSNITNYCNDISNSINNSKSSVKNSKNELINIGDMVLIKGKTVDVVSSIVFQKNEVFYKTKMNQNVLYRNSDLRKLVDKEKND